MTHAALEQFRRLRIVPLVVIDDPDKAGAVAAALADGGLPCAEVALRTTSALEALRRMARERPDVLVGAGTVLTREQAAQARDSGARFVVSPGLVPRVVEYCLANDLVVVPGVATPTEIGAALELGLTVLKFFPAEPLGGLEYLRAIAAPFGDVEFIPTGGVNAGNLAAYLAAPGVVACGGSWMAPRAWIRAGDVDRIRREAAQAVRLAQAGGKGS